MPTSPRVYLRWLRRPIKGLVQLTRYREYVLFVCVTTLLGAKIGGGDFDVRLLVVLAANILVVGFAFMYNDVEDAPDDALDAKKAKRNPISAGMISPAMGKAACVVVAVLVLALYAVLGWMPLLLGGFCLILAFLYSWRMARLKSVPVADLISHSLSLAGLQFLCAYFTYDQGKPYSWLFFLFVVFFSVYGELNNEMRDIVVDQKAGIRHTADLVGLKWTKVLMFASIGGGLAVIAIFFILGVIPLWILAVPILAGPMLFAEQLWNLIRRKTDVVSDREAMHEPAVLLGVITALAWFVVDRFPVG